MTLTVKLDREMETLLAERSRSEGCSKSAVVHTALRAYLVQEPASAYELGKEVFGKHGSGSADTSTQRHRYYAELTDAKRRARR